MRITKHIVTSFLIGVLCATNVVAAEQSTSAPPGAAPAAAAATSQLHFETVLTTHGEIVSVDRINRLLAIKGPRGNTLTLESRNQKNLEAIHAGDRVLIRYIEGVQIRKKNPGEVLPMATLKEGIAGAAPGESPKARISRKRTIVASVETIDEVNQEVTLKGPDGSIETVMVENPETLQGLKAGDQLVITYSHALALSVDNDNRAKTE
jgi:hypothetical protein